MHILLVLCCLIPYGCMAVAENGCEILGSLQHIYTKYVGPINKGLIYNATLEEMALDFRVAKKGFFQRATQKSFAETDPRNDQEKVDDLFKEFLQFGDRARVKAIPRGYPYGCTTRKCTKTAGQYFTVGCAFMTKGFSLARQFMSSFEAFFKNLNSRMVWDSVLSDQAVILLSNINLETPNAHIKTKVQTSLLSVDERSIRNALTMGLLPRMYNDDQLTKIRNQSSRYGCAMTVVQEKFLNLACIVN